MDTRSDAAPPAAGHGWRGFGDALNGRSVTVAMALALLVALALNPIFITPFPVLLGRTLFLAMVLLLAFSVAGRWSKAWLPRWLVQLLAVAVAAPLATLAVYLLSTGGDAAAVLHTPGRLMGFAWIAGSGMVLGLLLAFGALYRERDAQARSQALQFELEREQLERQALDARLSLLQAQIEPHFLFNTLANVQALVQSGSPRAAGLLGSLINYLRAALPSLSDEPPTLGKELALVRAYLELMQMRMPDRLQFEIRADPALASLRLPPMALLTLVENAVRHGIDPGEQGGRIEVGAAAGNGTARLWVSDSGVGLPKRAADRGRPGTGLANLRARLQGFHGDAARLELSACSPHGVRAEIVLPHRQADA